MPKDATDVPPVPEHHAVNVLRERVYIAFTGLAIVVAMAGGSHHIEPWQALAGLVVGVLGVASAAFVSDMIAHLAVHRKIPDVHGRRSIMQASFGAMTSLVIPSILLLLAVFDVLDLLLALRLAAIVYIVELAGIAWLAVRRARLTWLQQIASIVILAGLGVVVLVIQILAH